jgi:hypothetical protein
LKFIIHNLKHVFADFPTSGFALKLAGLLIALSVLAIAANPEQASADGDVIASITVPATISISSQSEATDKWDAPVQVRGGEVAIGSPGDEITIPAVPVSGWWVESLTDPTNGITIVRNDDGTGAVLRIPIRDAEGNDTIRVLVNTTDYIGDGWQATATIVSMSIDLPTRSRDFSDLDPEVGVASVKILGEITGFPGDSSMVMSIAKTTDAIDAAIVSALAESDGNEIIDIAYVVGLEKTNLDRVIGEMTLRLTVGKSWYDRYSDEIIQVVRIADDGSTQVFEWVAIDPEADPVQFDLVSPQGLSKFVIEVLRKAQLTPTPTLVPTQTPEPTPTLEPTATRTATPAPPTPTQSSQQDTKIEPTVVVVEPSPEPTSLPTPTAAPTSTTPNLTQTTTSAPTTQTSGSGDEDSITAAEGGSCNASAEANGMIGAGPLALVLFPLGLLAYKNTNKRIVNR